MLFYCVEPSLLLKHVYFFYKTFCFILLPLLILFQRILLVLTYAKLLCIELNQTIILQLMQKSASCIDVNQMSIELY
jgi:hypothetical protein